MTVREIRSYGATGTGDGPDTGAFQRALDDCARDGGVVSVPPGEYRSGPLVVGSDTTLRLRSGATLRFASWPTSRRSRASKVAGRDGTGPAFTPACSSTTPTQ